MDKYLIRQVVNTELDACAEVISQSFADVAQNFNLTIENCPTNGAFIKVDRLISDKQSGKLMYGLFVDNNLAGYMQLNTKQPDIFELEKLAVLPQHRHKGYGKALINYAAQKAKHMGSSYINIGIIEENTVLKNWYITYGFEHTGTKIFEHLPFTAGFMQLKIE